MRYAGVRLLDPAALPKLGKIVLTHVEVGGQNVSFEKECLHLGGKDYSPKEWLELRRRIDSVFVDRRLIEEVGPPKAPWEGRSSSFLTNNTMAILNHKKGFFKTPPLWLRWLYSAVVTKEQYHGDSD